MTRPQTDPARPRLLVLASTYPRWRGDPEPGFVHELARRLAGSFEVVVVGPHAAGAAVRERLDGVEVVRYRYAPARLETLVNDGGILTNLRRSPWKWLLVPGFAAMLAWTAWRVARARRVDVLHAHWLVPQGLAAALVGCLPGTRVPFVVTSHGADLHALRGRRAAALKRFVLRRAAAATVVSGSMRAPLRALGADLRKVRVQPMGVDLSGRFRREGAEPRSRHELLFVGRLVEKKGLRHLLDAMPAILRGVPEARLAVAGFGPEEDALRRQARDLGIDGAVRFLGPVPQAGLPALYRRAAVCVAPFVRARSGDEEGLGLVLVEAIGCGCPVVVGNVAAVGDVLPAGDPALVDAADHEALAAAVVATLADPAGAARAAGERGRDIDRFDWTRVAEAHAAILRAAMGAP